MSHNSWRKNLIIQFFTEQTTSPLKTQQIFFLFKYAEQIIHENTKVNSVQQANLILFSYYGTNFYHDLFCGNDNKMFRKWLALQTIQNFSTFDDNIKLQIYKWLQIILASYEIGITHLFKMNEIFIATELKLLNQLRESTFWFSTKWCQYVKSNHKEVLKAKYKNKKLELHFVPPELEKGTESLSSLAGTFKKDFDRSPYYYYNGEELKEKKDEDFMKTFKTQLTTDMKDRYKQIQNVDNYVRMILIASSQTGQAKLAEMLTFDDGILRKLLLTDRIIKFTHGKEHQRVYINLEKKTLLITYQWYGVIKDLKSMEIRYKLFMDTTFQIYPKTRNTRCKVTITKKL